MPNRLLAAVIFVFGLLVGPALADDWLAVKLRGQVYQLVEGEWQQLRRGAVVPDDRVVRTLKNGRAEFQRDREAISLGPDTQVQIVDRTGQRFTTVKQHFGEVSVEAEARAVQHFSVETPYLAAVVKGTRFLVRSGQNWSDVHVRRGHVAVESEITHSTTVISAGQSATATTTGELKVAGKGDLPTVISANGKIVSANGVPASTKDAAKLEKEAAKAAEKAVKEAEKATKAAEKAAAEEIKAVERAAKEAEKAASKAEGGNGESAGNSKSSSDGGNGNGGSSNSGGNGNGGDNSGSGSSNSGGNGNGGGNGSDKK